MHALSNAEAEPLQQQALAYRLEQLLSAIPPLAVLAKGCTLVRPSRTRYAI